MNTVTPVSLVPSFIGVGPAFPFQLDASGARQLIASGDALVQMSMAQIANTAIGERPFLTRNGVPYGTRVRGILFSDAASAIPVVQYELLRAFTLWEPRIIVSTVSASEVQLQSGGAAILSTTYYRYRSTNRPDNFVVPFLLTRPAST